MTLEDAYDLAEQYHCKVERFSLPETTSESISIDGTNYIGLDHALYGAKEKVCLCHETAHHAYAGLYTINAPFFTRGKIERSADKWSFLKLIPFGELKEITKDPFYRSLGEIADYFGVTPEFVEKAIAYYTSAVGLKLTEEYV